MQQTQALQQTNQSHNHCYGRDKPQAYLAAAAAAGAHETPNSPTTGPHQESVPASANQAKKAGPTPCGDRSPVQRWELTPHKDGRSAAQLKGPRNGNGPRYRGPKNAKGADSHSGSHRLLSAASALTTGEETKQHLADRRHQVAFQLLEHLHVEVERMVGLFHDAIRHRLIDRQRIHR